MLVTVSGILSVVILLFLNARSGISFKVAGKLTLINLLSSKAPLPKLANFSGNLTSVKLLSASAEAPICCKLSGKTIEANLTPCRALSARVVIFSRLSLVGLKEGRTTSGLVLIFSLPLSDKPVTLAPEKVKSSFNQPLPVSNFIKSIPTSTCLVSVAVLPASSVTLYVTLCSALTLVSIVGGVIFRRAVISLPAASVALTSFFKSTGAFSGTLMGVRPLITGFCVLVLY